MLRQLSRIPLRQAERDGLVYNSGQQIVNHLGHLCRAIALEIAPLFLSFRLVRNLSLCLRICTVIMKLPLKGRFRTSRNDDKGQSRNDCIGIFCFIFLMRLPWPFVSICKMNIRAPVEFPPQRPDSLVCHSCKSRNPEHWKYRERQCFAIGSFDRLFIHQNGEIRGPWPPAGLITHMRKTWRISSSARALRRYPCISLSGLGLPRRIF